MKVLLLGPDRPEVVVFLKSLGDEVVTADEPISICSEVLTGVDFIISYGYRHLLEKDIVNQFNRRIINLHISLLPWNRGADPNLWSFLEDTPKGVTIHYVDEGLDTGAILVQEQVEIEPVDTLRTSYKRLSEKIVELLLKSWPEIRSGNIVPKPQPAGGSYHRLNDKNEFKDLLQNGWDTPVAFLTGKALKKKG